MTLSTNIVVTVVEVARRRGSEPMAEPVPARVLVGAEA